MDVRKMKIADGQEVTLTIPFTYTIGEEGPVTGKILNTIEDCEDEVRAEIDRGMNGGEIKIEIEI